MSLLQNVWVSKCFDLYAVTQCLGGTMSGRQNVFLSKCKGVKKVVSKCPGVKRSCAEMSENHLEALQVFTYSMNICLAGCGAVSPLTDEFDGQNICLTEVGCGNTGCFTAVVSSLREVRLMSLMRLWDHVRTAGMEAWGLGGLAS